MRWTWAVLAMLAVVHLSACMDVADARAEYDTTIGKAERETGRVEVRGGLASVQRFEGRRVDLWGQAPVLDMDLEVRAGGEGIWYVSLRNAMRDAALVITDADGARLQSVAIAQELPTHKVWEIALPSAQTYRLSIAPPDAGDTSPWRFAVYADVQDRIDGVQDLYTRMRAEPDLRFALISGDLTEQGSYEQLTRFQREMETLPFPCFATIGNHELGVDDHMFQRLYGRVNLSFPYRGVRFTLLDSASATIAPRALRWLDGWLEEGRDGLHMVIMHIPPLDPAGNRNGAFASRGEANALVSRMARAGVDMGVYGHVHSFYTYTHAGIPAYITGGGGAIPERLDGIGRHFMIVEANPGLQTLVASVVRISPSD